MVVSLVLDDYPTGWQIDCISMDKVEGGELEEGAVGLSEGSPCPEEWFVRIRVGKD